MYIAQIKLWNFRQFTNSDGCINVEEPHLSLEFVDGLNVLIGENDSGKTSILDAIKLVTKTHSIEWVRLQESDFSYGTSRLRIEIVIKGIPNAIASLLVNKLLFDEESGEQYLVLVLEAEKSETRILPYEVKAFDGELISLAAGEKELVKATYLKALRDAENELTAKKNSRFSQILLGHDLFKDGASGKRRFEEIFQTANNEIKKWFNDTSGGELSSKHQIKDVIDDFIHEFLSSEYDADLSISDSSIKSILERVSVGIMDVTNLGLGSMNRLFMAAELLHLRSKNDGLRLCLIEELEAHLHPQAQMKVIEGLQKEQEVQFIMTTHSPNLASKLKLDSDNTAVILCKNRDAYPLTKGRTLLEPKDYKYLDNFLDVTKANLFFAKGVIIVEGWAEDLLIPALAANQGYSLSKQEVSVVNVGSTAYLHYARILMRNDGKKLDYPVAIVTDLDVPIDDDGNFDTNKEHTRQESIYENVNLEKCDNVEFFLATHWTLEWCLFKSDALSEIFKLCCMEVHSKTLEFKKQDDGSWDDASFQIKLTEKLKKQTLSKVKIATLMSQRIKESQRLSFNETDQAYYLLKALKFVCR